jgi:hypothetical protein
MYVCMYACIFALDVISTLSWLGSSECDAVTDSAPPTVPAHALRIDQARTASLLCSFTRRVLLRWRLPGVTHSSV